MSPAAPDPAQTRQAARLNLADLPLKSKPQETSPLPTASGERCRPTADGSKARKSGATQACVTVRRAAPTPARTATTAKSAQSAPSTRALAAGTGGCTLAAPGVYTYERFQYCVRGVEVLYTLRDSNGREIGSGTLEISTSASLPAQGTTWNEQVTTTMTRAAGQVTTLSAKFRAACTTGCKATKTAPWFGANLTVGQSVNGDVFYASTPAADQQLDFTTSYTMYVTTPGAQATDPNASWSNPRKIRCDDAVRDTTAGGTASPGCVVPSVMAAVDMSAEPVSSSGQGAAAATYHWAQRNLSDGWGFKKPLTRSKSGITDRKNTTCAGGTNPFQAQDSVVATDTCGEFPFAAALEGGKSGVQCTDIIPNYSSRGWDFYDGSATTSGIDTRKKCARGHVPAADLDAAEKKLAEGFAAQRILDAEQFDLNITAPSAQPQATCLQDPPARSFPAGAGWVRYTGVAVDNINKTTAPQGPGERPGVAQACVGKDPKEGTEAANDITGWYDARLYATTNNLPPLEISRCHLIANVLGGKGTRVIDRNNLVPCWQVGLNTGTPSMRTHESTIANTVKNNPAFGANDAVFYEVIPRYKDATSTIPLSVEMTATIQRANGTTQTLVDHEFVPNTRGSTGEHNLGN
ncbi:DNA/RNA non-specific endonuclease [Streptomyces sp. NPDC058459]|uniref:DNA/RNA non-specific endonuclease n=1 Tax=Streptomyces sp. NPDC058459 TaxID=3346508 RepID=UPI00364655F0